MTSLINLGIGLVGVAPGLFFLKTNSTNAQVQAPGFLNLSAAMSLPKPTMVIFYYGMLQMAVKYMLLP